MMDPGLAKKIAIEMCVMMGMLGFEVYGK